ncbi:MAG: IPExxxVDY family protein [Flavobacteriales bacterium]
MQWLDEDFADACDFELLGLSSHLPPHRLAWELNQHLEWRLEFFKVLKIQQRNGLSEHAVYRYEDMSSHGSQMWYIIENKTPNGMIARFKGGAEMDYLVQAMDEGRSTVVAMERIRSMRGVNYILQLDPLESGAIEHLALMDLTPEVEG